MKVLKVSLFFSLIIVGALMNCGCDSVFDLYPPHGEIYYYEAPSPAEAQKMAREATVDCQSFSSCSSSVGLLTGNTGANAYQCTAFLVAPQIAITNSHCIPRDLAAAGSDCSNRIWLHFPETSEYLATSAKCSRVIEATTLIGLRDSSLGETYSKLQPDFAVIELDRPVNRSVIPISRDGFQNERNYTIDKVDPVPGYSHIKGRLVSIECTAKYGDAPASQFNSSNIFFDNCDVVSGNSGSPVRDGAGAAHGVVQAISVPTDALSQTRDPLKQFEIMAKAPRMGTNFACLNLPAVVGAPEMPSTCGALSASR